MTISEKVAYISGLAEGMNITSETNEGKLTLAMLDVLKDIALELEEFDETLDDMAEIVGDLEEQVEDLEDELYSDDYDDFDYDEDDLYEINCSNCGNSVAIDIALLESGVVNCPNCGEKIQIDLDFTDCDCAGGRTDSKE